MLERLIRLEYLPYHRVWALTSDPLFTEDLEIPVFSKPSQSQYIRLANVEIHVKLLTYEKGKARIRITRQPVSFEKADGSYTQEI